MWPTWTACASISSTIAQTHGRVPLVLTHGWPSTFVELLSLVDRLGDRFDLVVPSLPGYAFSQRPPHAGVDRAFVARLWHRLMQGLGYERYGAHGGDFGAGVATYMALSQPDRVIGIHLSTPEMWPYTGPGAPPLSLEEQAYVDHVARWEETERGYSAVQSTRPQTLGYGLNDSPAGLAAWVLDKWRSWSDSGGDLDARFGRDALLTMLTIWWATGSITSSMRDYYDNRWHGTPIGPSDFVAVPTAMAVFANEFVPEGRAATVLVRAAVPHSALDGLPTRRSFRRSRGARPAGRRHRRILYPPAVSHGWECRCIGFSVWLLASELEPDSTTFVSVAMLGQHGADRLDAPDQATGLAVAMVSADELHDQWCGRSSPAAKKVETALRIPLARLSSAFSRRNLFS